MPRTKNIEVMVEIINTHQDTLLGEKRLSQLFLLSKRIGGVLEWMNYKGISIR